MYWSLLWRLSEEFKYIFSSHWVPNNLALFTAQANEGFSAQQIFQSLNQTVFFDLWNPTGATRRYFPCSNKASLLKESQIITSVSLWHIIQIAEISAFLIFHNCLRNTSIYLHSDFSRILWVLCFSKISLLTYNSHSKKFHSLKTDNSMTFGIFPDLYNHNCNLILEYFHHSKKKLYTY